MAARPSFDALRRALDSLADEAPLASLDALSRLVYERNIPPEFSWADLSRGLARPEDVGNSHYLRALRVCLDAADAGRVKLVRKIEERREEEGEAEKDDTEDETEARQRICAFAAESIAPVVPEPSEADDELDDESRIEKTTKRCRVTAEDGLVILKRASASGKDGEQLQLDRETLHTLVAYADTTQPYTTETAASLASELLDRNLPATEDAGKKKKKKNAFIVEDVLTAFLRPLFSKSRPATVTASGRKAEFAAADGGRGSALETETPAGKPWKYRDLRAVPNFAWAVGEADDPLVNAHWPLFTPVILTLLDDPDTRIRARGLALLRALLRKFPAEALRRTGLARVFEDAVLPALLYLPALTPVDESVALLGPAYAALLALADRLGPPEEKRQQQPGGGGGVDRRREKDEERIEEEEEKNRLRLLDRVLREGVLAGFFHAQEHARVVEVLARQAGAVVEAMGVHAVKHLKDLIPMLSAIMTDPFATAHAPSLAAATRTLQTVLANCWPRVGTTPWAGEVTKILAVCWLNVRDDGVVAATRRRLPDVEAELVRTAAVLRAILQAAGVDADARFRPLVAREPLLGPLFGS